MSEPTNNGWISLLEKRPEMMCDVTEGATWVKSEPVLINSLESGVTLAQFQIDFLTGQCEWMYDGRPHKEYEDGHQIITHWMPLPKGPYSQEPTVSKEETSTPPTPKTVVSKTGKKFKRYTPAEKTEIAVMYSGGFSIAGIAKEFDRTPASIQKLISTMGVKRGQDVLNSSPDEDVKAQGTRKTKQSKLEKPWYLKK